MLTQVNKYRKKPVTIEAIQFSRYNLTEVKEFLGDNYGDVAPAQIGNFELLIKTLEDGRNNQVRHIATEFDFIIKGVAGEFYACKPEIFYKTYELDNE